MSRDRRYTEEPCECGNAFCSGCDEEDSLAAMTAGLDDAAERESCPDCELPLDSKGKCPECDTFENRFCRVRDDGEGYDE